MNYQAIIMAITGLAILFAILLCIPGIWKAYEQDKAQKKAIENHYHDGMDGPGAP